MAGNSLANTESAVLVIGAGIGGIKASLELAEGGAYVYLCDQRPFIGGTLSQLDIWFPDDHCNLCQVLPQSNAPGVSQQCLRQGLSHPRIEQLPSTRVEKVDGEAGNFCVTMNTRHCGIRRELCTGCGQCMSACPVEVDSEFNVGLGMRKAVYPSHPFNSSAPYIIDPQNCTRCGACVKHCPTGAIDLSFEPGQREIRVGAIIVAAGSEGLNPLTESQYGYRRFPNVITGTQLERLLSGSGPNNGELRRNSDGKTPQSVAFLQCVGSRTREKDYCSSACCLYALKEAMLIKRKYPDTEVYFFFMDLRAFGKGGYRYYEKAASLGIKFVRSRPPRVGQNFRSNNLLLTWSAEDGKIVTQEFELVVLSVGQTPPPQFDELSQVLRLKLNKWGFCQTGELFPVETGRKGIYVCGSVSSPKDIADTVSEATAASGRVLALLSPVRSTAETKPAIQEEPRLAIYLCNCGGQIDHTINLGEVLEFSRLLPRVVHVNEVDFLCRPEVLESVKSEAAQAGANRIIVAACSSPALSGLNSGIPVEIVNLREQGAWVHRDESVAATEKAKRLIAMTVEKVRLKEERALTSLMAVNARALVIGGGLAGLVAALSVAERGFAVELVEKTSTVGGHLNRLHHLLEGGDARSLMQDLIQKVENQPLIHLRTETEVAGISGCAGDFKVMLKQKGAEDCPVAAGAIIVASGAQESQPAEYLYGQVKEVMTQLDLEQKLASGEIKSQALKSVAMLQCVGSRDSQRHYCSRVCCAQAVKNALKLKQLNPQLDITVFYRDMMTYGLKEEYYTAAREQGIDFVRYELEHKPRVGRNGDKLEIHAREPVLGGEIVLQPDLLVLSPAMVPGDNAGLARQLGVELDADGFFGQAEVKFCPADTLKEGIYICGLAHAPCDVSETIVQAQSAAQRAAQLLSQATLSASDMISVVNERWCTGCELCVRVCPFDVRYKDLEKGVVKVREALCRGCGACVAACPSGASRLQSLTQGQLISMVDAAI